MVAVPLRELRWDQQLTINNQQSTINMDLILCHQTADFDALGAAVGLTKLHPGAKIVLTGGAHPSVKDFWPYIEMNYP